MPDPVSGCRNMIYASWAIGGAEFYFPQHVGLEYSGPQQDSLDFVLLEIHYDNPEENSGIIDSSGFRVFYTETLRQYSAEVALIGHDGEPTDLFIPAGLPYAMSTSYCDISNTDLIPDDGIGIRVFANLLHAHIASRSLRVRQIRNGIELPPIDTNDAYDFNYQQFIATDEISILPNDKIIVECVWNTSLRQNTIYRGPKATDEMCHTWFFFYPKIGFKQCRSSPTPKC
eukprot:167422_1